MKLVTTVQVAEFIRALAPEPRKRLKAGIKGLLKDEGDITPLEANLDGSYRVIFQYRNPVIHCIFAERRELVYEVFSAEMRKRLMEK